MTAEQLEKYLQMAQGENPIRFIFRVRESGGDVVGHIELDRLNREHRTGSVSRVFVDPSRRGRGIASEMVRRIVALGFERHALRRVDLGVFAWNAPAICCYEKLGFGREGCLRKAVLVQDEVWDLVLMGMLREEWEKHG